MFNMFEDKDNMSVPRALWNKGTNVTDKNAASIN